MCGCSDMKKRLVLLTLGVLLYGWGVLCCQEAGTGMGLTEVRLTQSVDVQRAAEILENETSEDVPLRFCLRGRGGEETVSGELTGVSRRVQIEYLAGNSELLGWGGLAWEKGCLIDEATARALFGTEICGGQTLLWQGESCPVLGTVSGSQARLLVMAREEDGAVLDHCLLEGEDGEGFLLRHGLEGRVLDLAPFWALTRNLLLVMPCLVLLTLAARLGKGWKGLNLRQLRTQWKGLVKITISLGLAGVAVWLVKAYIVIPADMIPSRWSDFSFWGSWWESQRENLSALQSAQPWEERLQMAENMVKSMGSALGSTLLTAWGLRARASAETC